MSNHRASDQLSRLVSSRRPFEGLDDLGIVRRVEFVLTSCERFLRLEEPAEALPLEARLDRILDNALPGGLDASLYRACWQFRLHFSEPQGAEQ